ncbi:LuxR C-terminal-related transcriptional regulator [Streptomyces sp. NPDC007808]|uniref:LuxR C-terminal-related transcriptional regulator n=1 Tax=Streptomyces sp. NPDC007808 TaxID=3364779 RepID=UPI003680E844
MTIQVLVACAGGLARAGIVRILDSAADLSVIGQAAHAAQAARLSRQLAPQVVVLEGTSAELEQPAVVRSITEPASTDVLLLTPADADSATLWRALSVGVVGLLPMDAAADQLLHAVRLIAQGGGFLDSTVVRPLVRAAARHTPPRADSLGEEFTGVLTPREQQVLVCVGQGMSNMDIAKKLLVSENTVKTHVSRMLTKLGLRSRVEAALTIRGTWSAQVPPFRARLDQELQAAPARRAPEPLRHGRRAAHRPCPGSH